MIAYLKGRIIYKTSSYLILLVNDIGYKIYTSAFSQTKTNDLVSIWIYPHTSSDYQTSLYGFTSPQHLTIFNKLLKVPGIGPKIAQKIIESDSLDNVKQAIFTNDVNFFTRIKGLGKKGAQKIILELKNTLVEQQQLSSDTLTQALFSLGFTKKEINYALDNLDLDNLNDEAKLEKVLQFLGK